MKIVATIEIPIPDIDEESKSQWDALKKLESNPGEMIERIYVAIESTVASDFTIHSPHVESGEI